MSSSAKFKLEVKATESSVANFSSGTKDTNIIITPDYYSNIHYAVIGTKAAESSHVYISVGSNGYDTTVATFSESNINFHKDTIVRGNLVIDGFLTALELDVVLSQKEMFEGTNHGGFIDAGSNVLSFKYTELTDTSITYTSNTITQKIQSSFSNLYIAGKNVLQGNSEFLEGFSSQEDPYTVDKFYERLASKTADDIVNGTTNRYIYNDKYNNNLVVKGDFTADNITTKTIYAEDEVSAGTLYGDGSYLTNIIAGDGTINSITEGCNLFYKPEYVGEIAAASNIHASNYVAALYNAELQTAILAKFEETSNFTIDTSNMLADTLYTEMTNISNYVASDFTGVEQLILNDYNYIDENILESSNYMQNFNAVYLQTDALSNLLIETIVPAIADASNYIQQTSNTLYTNLSITDTNVLVDLQTQLDAIIQLQAEKWANISNMILGEVGYSNLFDTTMKNEYGIHLDSYIVSSSNQAAVETDMQTSNTILHIDGIRADSIDTKTEYYFQHMADIATILTDTYTLIDSNSQASSNAVDVVRQNILNYLNDMIQGHILHLNDTCNLFHYTSNVTQTAIKDILKNTLDYERNSSNELMYTLDANIARLLGNASFVLNKTNADISGKLSSLDTDKIPEGTSNIYYTEAEFDRLFAKLTFDNFQQGANNKFIVNNVYNGNLRVLGTIFASNMVIDGELSTILTNVYQSGAARISSSNETPLSIAQYDNTAYIFGLSNTMNNPIFTVDNSGSIAINRTSASQDVDVSGILKTPMLKGLASTITDVNLDSKGTDFLAEGVNLYFNSSRVSYLIDTSNLNVSNYVIVTSNNLLEGFSIIRSQSNYIDQQSNIVYAYSSNININTFNYLNLIVANVSNIVGISSNNHSNYVLRTSNALIAYTSNSLVNISNYVITTSNALLGQLKFNEYIQSNYLTIVNSAISFAKAESDGSNYVLRSSNMLSAYMDNARFGFHQSNYAARSCNMLFNSIRSSNFHLSNYLIITSNNVMRSISTSNINISNYIWRTSNELMTYVLNNIGGVSATTNAYTITDVFTSDKILHFNFNNLKIINNADDPNFQLLNRTTITPVYPNISALTSVNNFFTQYETTNRYALASSNNIYVFNNDDTDAKTVLNMMNASGFVIHFVFRAQFVQNTPIYFIGNNVRSFVNIKLWYGNLQMMLGTGTDAITLVCLTPIVPFTWYIVDIVGAITGANISFKVWFNKIQQNIIVRRNTSVSSVGLLQTSVYNNVLNYSGVNNLQMLLGCSNLTDTYEENFPYTQGATYTNTYYSSNPWTMTAPAPILRSVASDYWSFSNLIFSSYYASNFDYQYSLGISSANVVNNTFFDNADARLIIGDRDLTKLNYVFTEVETNVRLRTGYYFFMLDLQNEITADLLLGEQSDTKIDDYFNVANYYNYNNNVLTTTPSATITHANNRVLANPLYIPEGYYRFYLRMFRTIANRNNRYFISQYYYTNTWSGTSYSFNNSNVVSYIPYSSLNSSYQSGRTNFNDLFVVNNNVTGATSNLYVYEYFGQNTMYGAGYNKYGSLGFGNTQEFYYSFEQVLNEYGKSGFISDVIEITSANMTTLVRKNDGSVYSCGRDISYYGEGGKASFTDSTRLNLIFAANSQIIQISGGNHHTLFLKNDGTVLGCGYNGGGNSTWQSLGLGADNTNKSTPVQIFAAGSGITQIAAGVFCSYFLKGTSGSLSGEIGSVYGCGFNGEGNLGTGDNQDKITPVQMLNVERQAGYISGITKIATGGASSTVLLLQGNNGMVYGCGQNNAGQLALNNRSSNYNRLHTLWSANTDVKDIYTNYTTFILKNNGDVYVNGDNVWGKAGIGVPHTTTPYVMVPTYILNNVKKISVSYASFVTFLRSDNSVWGCGEHSGQLGALPSQTYSPSKVIDSPINSKISDIYSSRVATFYLLPTPLLAYVSNYNYSISHSNVITPNTFFAANRLSSSNLLNIQDFKILNNLPIMASDFAINNILYNGKDSSNLVSLNKIRFNKWRETDNYASLTNKYVYYTEGNVGIGNTVPSASFDINTNIITPLAFDTSTIYSMKTNRPVWTNLGLITSSDERIKKNIQDIDDNVALNQILKVEPKSYNYIDRNNTSSNIYGFIAQQIREVIPQAISLHTEAVPNIYTIGTLQSNIITVNLPSLSSAKQVLLIDVLGNRYVENISQLSQLTQHSQHSQTSIEIENKNNIPDGPIFVYGTIVNDFHALDKSYIYTLNVCALQDVYKNYANLKDQLSAYMQSYSNITQQPLIEYDNTSLVANQNELKNQIDLLKYANDTLMQNINIIKQLQTSNYAEMQQLKAENDLLTAANNEITKEHENLIKQISEQSQEIFTIKSILQLNNVV